MFRLFDRHASVAVFFVFALCAPAAADEAINLSTEYVSPYGDYETMQVRDTFTVGVAGTATSTATFYGNATQTRGHLAVEGLTNFTGGVLRTYGSTSFNAGSGGYRVGINSGGVAPLVECEVNGDIFAGMFRASPAKRGNANDPTFDQDCLLYFGPSIYDGTNATTQARYGVYMGSYSGPDSTAAAPVTNPPVSGNGGWADQRSACRIYGSPMIVLNGRDDLDNPGGTGASTDYKMQFSGGNVGIGNASPTSKLHVGNGTTYAVGYQWQAFSSRDYKRDIAPLGPSELRALGDKIGGLEVVRYRYLNDRPDDPLRLGLIAEDAPAELLSVDGKALHSPATLAFIIAGVRSLWEENQKLEADIAALESKLAARKGGQP